MRITRAVRALALPHGHSAYRKHDARQGSRGDRNQQSSPHRRVRRVCSHEANNPLATQQLHDEGCQRKTAQTEHSDRTCQHPKLVRPHAAEGAARPRSIRSRHKTRIRQRSWLDHRRGARIRTCFVAKQQIRIRNFDLGIRASAGWSGWGRCVLFSHSDGRNCFRLSLLCKSHWSKIRVPSKSKRKRNSSSPASAIARPSFRRFSA